MRRAPPGGSGAAAAPLFFAGTVYVFSYEAGAVSRLLGTSPFQKLGLWSYSIYMVHALIVFVIGLAASELQRRLGIDLWRTIIVDGSNVRVLVSDHVFLLDALHLAYAVLVVFVAAVTYRLIERPGQRYFQNLADRTEPFQSGRLAPLQPIRQCAKGVKAIRLAPVALASRTTSTSRTSIQHDRPHEARNAPSVPGGKRSTEFLQ